LVVAAGGVATAMGLALAAVHVAAERRRSTIQRLSAPAKLASIVPAVAGVFLLMTWHQSRVAAEELRWESNEAQAVARASAEHRPMLVDFGAAWCGACKELQEKTFPDPAVRREAARFVALQVDGTDDDDQEVTRVRRKYRATEGLPVVILLGSDGHEAARFTEFVPADRLAGALALVQ
jgi:thiol:disulfide interchange protein DsbD